MPEIPEELKWFQLSDEPVRDGSVPWELHVDDITGTVEFKRGKFASGIGTVVSIGIVQCIVILALAFYAPLPPGFQKLFTVAAFVIPLAIIGFSTAMTFLCNSNLNNSLATKRIGQTFRYVPQSRELFFPLNNAVYRPEDYSRLVFGCVRGWDTRRFLTKIGGTYWKSGKGHAPWITQLFMLFLQKDGEWKRLDIASEFILWPKGQMGSQLFIDAVDRLRPHLEFEVFVKDYSQDECFAQQHEQRDGTGNKVLWQ